MSKNNKSAFAGLGDVLAGGFDETLTTGDTMTKISVDDVEVRQQVRDSDQLEDEENTLNDLGNALVKRQLQNIVVRPNTAWIEGGPAKRYILVAGERRFRAAVLKGITHLWALVAEMTDEEAEDLQFAENIHRKNLTQLEEAKRIQRDLDALGSVEAVLEKHQKGRPWLSKITALLRLPEQTKRLIKENISADLEVINTVKTIENMNPAKAREVVDDLKKTRGKVNARETVAKVKDTVKPPKKKPGSTGSVATARDRAQEAPSHGQVFAGAKSRGARPLHEDALSDAFMQLFEGGKTPKAVLDGMKAAQREAIDEYLRTFYDAGKQAKDPGRIVIEGFRNGGFASDGVGAFALVAYLQGMDGQAKFSPLNILGCLKA